ncbi:hypothetical protein [Streptomyces sp. CT34]|uniref:hypothetical protein n=1 Tax=Streptomyces sp. CT34 TaxID=1553907 RepID=UPI0012FED34E|nr:hypothetical protein [Streptomyces sp. CT34]
MTTLIVATVFAAAAIPLWNSQEHAARVAVVFAGPMVIAALCTWSYATRLHQAKRKGGMPVTLSAFLLFLLIVSWGIGIPASLFMAPFAALAGATSLAIGWLAHTLVLKGHWAGVLLHMSQAAVGAAVSLWRPVDDGFWNLVLGVCLGFLVLLPTGFAWSRRGDTHKVV